MAEEVLAPLAGNIWQILVEVGASVKEDDELFIVEAMKMENLVYASCDGKITKIKVKEGDQVDEDAVVMVIE